MRWLETAVLIGVVTPASGQGITRPQVPAELKAAAGEEVVLEVHASGSQIYTCQQGTDTRFVWTLKAPDAELRDQQGTIIGRHYAGPTWKHRDGVKSQGRPLPGWSPQIRMQFRGSC